MLIFNVLFGASVKLVGQILGKWLEVKRQKELAIINADTDRIVALQKGKDKLGSWAQFTRRFIAITFSTTFCFVVVYFILHPQLEIQKVIPKDASWIWSLFFNTTKETVLTVNSGTVFWDFKCLVEIIIGFYFTRID